jgi:hypothetical protein
LVWFFDISGIIHFELVARETTVNWTLYVEVLKRLIDAGRSKPGELWRDRSLILHHNNAPVCSSLPASQRLAGNVISAADHPPYCPHLAPADVSLSPELKSVLKSFPGL